MLHAPLAARAPTRGTIRSSSIVFGGLALVIAAACTDPVEPLDPGSPAFAKGGNNPKNAPAFRIVFESGRTGDPEVFVMDGDGANVTNLSNVALAFDGGPSVSPDGSRVAFYTDRDGDIEIYFMGFDGSKGNLSNNLGADRLPVWSPDGSRIAFVSNRDGGIDDIFVMDVLDGPEGTIGGPVVNVSNTPVADQRPRWSPDGTRIVFETDLLGARDLIVVDAIGGNATNITNTPEGEEFSAAWAPDGSQIAFRGDGQIWVMNPDGSGKTQLTNSSGINTNPDWSPDASKIAFESDRDTPGLTDIYVMRRNGSGQMRLTNNSVLDFQPVWSPDGRNIAFTRRVGTLDNDIFVMTASGKNQTNLTNNGANDTSPVWVP